MKVIIPRSDFIFKNEDDQVVFLSQKETQLSFVENIFRLSSV